MKRVYLKNFLIITAVVLVFFGCLGEQKVQDPSDDPQILSVSIQENDSSPNASSAVFTINQEDSIIFNVDSLPYGTRIDSLHLSFNFASSSGFIINDTVPESPHSINPYASATSGRTSASVDFNKLVKVKNIASDEKHSKAYTIELRVHTVDTYLHSYTQLNSAIKSNPSANQKAVMLNNTFYYFFGYESQNDVYSSTDGKEWTSMGSPENLPIQASLRDMVVYGDSILLLHNGNEIYKSDNGKSWKMHIINADTNYDLAALLFVFKEKLWAVAKDKSTNAVRIVSSDDGINWEFNEKREFFNFPVKNFSATRFKPIIGREKVLITGGFDAFGNRLNTLWSAENVMGVDTLYWVNLQHRHFKLDQVSDAGTAYYGGKMLMMGGKKSDTELSDTLYQLAQSIDEGLTWQMPDSTQHFLPEEYGFRSNVSVIQDEEDLSLYLIGGSRGNQNLSDVWKVKVNFYSFKDYLEDPKKY